MQSHSRHEVRTLQGREAPILLGVVHLPPLPGSPRHQLSVRAITEHARRDAERILAAGFDGYVVENFGDAPFFAGAVPRQVLTCMTAIIGALPRPEGALIGVNVLRNDALGALAIAAACELDFIRVNVLVGAMVTDQGIVEGRAAEVLRERQTLAPRVALCADVEVKHASPIGAFDRAEVARETAYRGLADALIVTGRATGSPASVEALREVRAAVPDRPLLVGSGVTSESIGAMLSVADGVIVGTALKEGGRVEAPIDPRRARQLVAAAR